MGLTHRSRSAAAAAGRIHDAHRADCGESKAGPDAARRVRCARTPPRVPRRLQRDGVPPEPMVYIAVSMTVLLVAEAASFFPAQRATRIDPVIAIRIES